MSIKKKKRRISEIPLAILAPSIITMLALCLGVTSIRYALDSKFETATALIMIAAVMDGLDGRVARLLNTASDFGLQLDSLSDLVSFGVAPGIIMYMWSLHEIPLKGMGWSVILFYVVCSAFRLARFNVKAMDDEERESYKQNFFVGVPIPAAAALSLLPMITTFSLFSGMDFSYWFTGPYMVIVGLLMVSKVPSFSGKKISIKRKHVLPIFVLIGVIIIGTLMAPWIALPVVGMLYILSIPVSAFFYYKKYRI